MKSMIFLLSLLISSVSLAADKGAELNLDEAQRIASKATICAVKNGWKLSIAIVNSEGNLIYFQRADGSYSGSVEASIDKAKSANAFQRPTKAFGDGLREGRTELLTLKNVVAIEGGVPIQYGGRHAGAIGISGARAAQDEQCAKFALE